MLMTCGAAGGLNVVFKALLNPGDEVIILAPYFVEYNFYLDNHGGSGRVVQYRRRFQPRPGGHRRRHHDEDQGRSSSTRPNNPTGQIYPAESLAALGRLLEQAGKRLATTIYLIADEPYRKIIFDDNTVPSVFAAYRNSIVVSSYSKDLSLPGERIGYLAVHPEIDDKTALLDAMTLANRILGFVNAPALMQRVVAAAAGRDGGHLASMPGGARCSAPSWTRPAMNSVRPKGAFYIFPKSPIADDVEFCRPAAGRKDPGGARCRVRCPGLFPAGLLRGRQDHRARRRTFQEGHGQSREITADDKIYHFYIYSDPCLAGVHA